MQTNKNFQEQALKQELVMGFLQPLIVSVALLMSDVQMLRVSILLVTMHLNYIYRVTIDLSLILTSVFSTLYMHVSDHNRVRLFEIVFGALNCILYYIKIVVCLAS